MTEEHLLKHLLEGRRPPHAQSIILNTNLYAFLYRWLIHPYSTGLARAWSKEIRLVNMLSFGLGRWPIIRLRKLESYVGKKIMFVNKYMKQKYVMWETERKMETNRSWEKNVTELILFAGDVSSTPSSIIWKILNDKKNGLTLGVLTCFNLQPFSNLVQIFPTICNNPRCNVVFLLEITPQISSLELYLLFYCVNKEHIWFLSQSGQTTSKTLCKVLAIPRLYAAKF